MTISRSFCEISDIWSYKELKLPDGIEPSSPDYKSGTSPLNALGAKINQQATFLDFLNPNHKAKDDTLLT